MLYLRNIEESDFEHILHISNICFLKELQHPNIELFKKNVLTYKNGCFVCVYNNEIIGFFASEKWDYVNINNFSFNRNTNITHSDTGKFGYVSWMAVLPGYEYKKIGCKFTRQYLLNNENKIHTHIIISQNEKIEKFYRFLGFQRKLEINKKQYIMSSTDNLIRTSINKLKLDPILYYK